MEVELRTFLRRHRFVLAAGALIFMGVALRLLLTLIGWPHSDSEEGTMGLEAMHIMVRGEHPVYLYGQNYMGVGEAYVASLAYRVFGISVTSLRLGMIAFYAVFMVGVFWLAHQLYSRRVALVSLAILVLGTPFLVQIELLADGGKVETLAFGAVIFALASWLALSRTAEPRSAGQRVMRMAAFAGWGLIAGLGTYTYPIFAPFALTSGVLLAVTCWRELIRGTALLALAGLTIGYMPAILYALSLPTGGNPVSVFLSLHQSLNAGGGGGRLLIKQVEATLLFTLPTVTGFPPLYSATVLPLFGPTSPATVVAVILGGGWCVLYLALLATATYRPARALRARLRERGKRPMPAGPEAFGKPTGDEHQTESATRDLARLLLALTGWLIIAAYAASPTAANNPYSGRYMIGLLVLVPAILWPLFDRRPLNTLALRGPIVAAAVGLWRPLTVAALVIALVVGAAATIRAVPPSVALDQKDASFEHALLSRGITRFYSDYWTCDLLNFETREGLICGNVTDYGQPTFTRYAAYLAAVQADPNAPYVLVSGSEIDRTFEIEAQRTNRHYVALMLDGYTIYTPTT